MKVLAAFAASFPVHAAGVAMVNSAPHAEGKDRED